MLKKSQKLQALLNTLKIIETKGDSTKAMAECLAYVESLIKEFDNEEKEAEKAKGPHCACPDNLKAGMEDPKTKKSTKTKETKKGE